MRAIWKDKVIAESDDTIAIENNQYFPPDSINKEFLTPSTNSTHCAWKGDASYYHVEVDGETNKDAAWFYADPKDAAKEIKNYVAFWKGVIVRE